jgi:hypothetical protein
VRVDDDLGMSMLWKVDDSGRYDAQWEIPLDAPVGTYRLVVTAKRYRVESPQFVVEGAAALTLVEVPAPPGRVTVALQYPDAVRDVDLTARPKRVNGGIVRFRVGNRIVQVLSGADTFSAAAPPGVPVSVDRGGARDAWGNFNGAPLTLR